MSKAFELSAIVSSKGQIFIPADVRRLKGRLPKPPQPVTAEDMNRAVSERRAAIGQR